MMKSFNLNTVLFITCILGIICFVVSGYLQANDGDLGGVLICYTGCIWIINYMIKGCKLYS